MSLLQAGESQAHFTIDIPPITSLIPDGEAFALVVVADGMKATLGQIAAPWAVDAKGTTLPTSYSLSGNVLTQHVETRGATYPIVADPTITIHGTGGSAGPGVYWNMFGFQAKTLMMLTVATLQGSIGVGCYGAAKIPRVGKLISLVCAAIGAPSLLSIWKSITSIMRNTKISNLSCYQIRVLPRDNALLKTDKNNCR